MREYKTHLMLFAIGCVTLLTFLGYTEFYTKGEPREAIVSVTMLDSGNWILPTDNGCDIAYKPPFFHWCIAAASAVVGEVNEYTSRFPSAVALIAMTVATFAFYRRRRGDLLALLTALLTFTNFEVHRAGVACRVDMVLTACMVMAMYLLYRWVERQCKGVPVMSILLMSAAVLTKGPVGMVLPCLVAGVFLLLRGRGFWYSFWRLSTIGIGSLVLPAVWYLAAYHQGGQQFVDLVMEENFGRFTGTMSYDSHVNPWYYNVMTLVAGFVPYTILVLISLFFVKGVRKPSLDNLWGRLKAWIGGMDDTRLYSLLALVLIFVFYCIPKSKRSVYLMPMYPFVAYFLAELMKYLVENKHKAVAIFIQILGRAYEILFVLFVTIKYSSFTAESFASVQLYVDAIRASNVNLLQMLAIVLPILLFELRCLIYERYTQLKYYLAPLLVMAIFLSLDSTYQPIVLNAKADRATTEKVISLVPKGPIYSYVGIDMMRFFIIDFYSGNRVGLFEVSLPESGYVLLPEKDASSFWARHNDYDFSLVYRSNLKGCDVRDYVTLYKFSRRSSLSSPR